MKRHTFSISSLCFGFFLLANPAYFVACSVESGGFQYGEADMLELVDQLNAAGPLDIELPLELSGYQIEFELVQSAASSSETEALLVPPRVSWIQSAQACSSRTFVKEAAACESYSTLKLEGTARINDGATVVKTLDVSGSMEVSGNLLSNADFRLSFEGGNLWFDWDDDAGGVFSGVELSDDLGLVDPEQDGLGGARQ